MDKDKMKESIVKYGQKIFDKYLLNRTFNEEKASEWQENIVEDILSYCKDNFKEYNFFIISFLSSQSTSYNSSASGILRDKTDDFFSFNNSNSNQSNKNNSSDFHIEIRIFYFLEKLKPKGNYISIENKIIKKNIEITKKILDERKYSFDSCDKYINSIPVELTDYILQLDKSRYYYCLIYLYKINTKDWYINYNYSGKKPFSGKIVEVYSGENIQGISYIFSW